VGESQTTASSPEGRFSRWSLRDGEVAASIEFFSQVAVPVDDFGVAVRVGNRLGQLCPAM
jgi:hypothetical protein